MSRSYVYLTHSFVASFVGRHGVCVEGEFGAMMAVQLTNDGPVTITLESDGNTTPTLYDVLSSCVNDNQ